MKASALGVLATLLLTSLLAGCLGTTEDGGQRPTCEESHDIPEGHGWAIIFIDQPVNRKAMGFLSLWAKPSVVAWKSADNMTPDYVGASVNQRLDWTVATQVWYTEEVPAGNYSFIRFRVDDPVQAQRVDGSRPDIGVRGKQLTYQMQDARVPFHIEEGKCTHMAFSARIVTPGVTRDFEIESALRESPARR